MNSLKLHSNRSSALAKIIRGFIGLWGLMYLISFLKIYFNNGELTFIVILQGVLGFAMIIAAIFFSKMGDPKEIILNDDFVQLDEGTSYTRTAHWHKIDRLALSRFGIHIRYQSGTPERFRLPFLSGDKFAELQEWLQTKTDEHDITFKKKPWWKLF